jgi:hypothetical protein
MSGWNWEKRALSTYGDIITASSGTTSGHAGIKVCLAGKV